MKNEQLRTLSPCHFSPLCRGGGVSLQKVICFIASVGALIYTYLGGGGDAALAILLPIAVAAQGGANEARGRSNRGTRARRVLMIGRNPRTRRHFDFLEKGETEPVSVIGVLDHVNGIRCESDDCQDLLDRHSIPELGDVDRLSDVLREHPVDEVLVTLPIKSCYDQIQQAVQTCQEAGVTVSLCGNLFSSRRAGPEVEPPPANARKIMFPRVPYPAWKLAIKRGTDIAGAVFALTVLALPMLAVAVAVKLTSKGPVFFRQRRAGLNHRPFYMLKFRTMVKDAEKLRSTVESLNELDGPVFKIAKDPRITKIGKFLRKYSLDELPQFFNVLRGEMSLVGPRPPIPKEVEQYEWWQRRRLSMKPGLTCLWQVSGRNKISFREWMLLDLEYIDNWSLKLDIKLLFKTIPAVLLGRGAS